MTRPSPTPDIGRTAQHWYGTVPGQWDIKRFKYIGRIRNGQVDPELPAFRGLPLYAPDYIESGTGRLADLETAADQGAESGKYLVDPGDVIYSKIRPALRKVAIAPERGLCSADMYSIKPQRGVDGGFLFWTLLSEGFYRYSLLESDRVAMPKINRQALGNCLIPLPPTALQRSIGAFLDRKTAAIDQLIQKKERLVELLQEKRQALITRAVTKGLDASAPMKDSGVDYIGAIPYHWRTLRIALASEKLCNGYVGPTRDILVDEGIPYLQSLHIKDGEIRFEKPYFITPRWLAQHRRVRLRRDDVVIVQTGDIGQAAVIPDEWDGAGCHALIIFRPLPAVGLGRFFAWFLRSTPGRELLLREQTGALHPHLEVGKVREIPLPVPPITEQLVISSRLASIDAGLSQRCGAVNKQIALLNEYRQALISAAVTGQVDLGSAR